MKDVPETKKPEPTTKVLKALCRSYGIANEEDSLFIEEFVLVGQGDQRVDVVTIDLQKLMLRGFEVKVSRADFLADQKWQSYLHHFNYFYFVAPPGIIKPEELLPEVYLLEWAVDVRKTYEGETERYFPYLNVRKRGKRLQPRFVRETYGENFFHRIILKYLRDLRWRSRRRKGKCSDCAGLIDENLEAAVSA